MALLNMWWGLDMFKFIFETFLFSNHKYIPQSKEGIIYMFNQYKFFLLVIVNYEIYISIPLKIFKVPYKYAAIPNVSFCLVQKSRTYINRT